VGYRTSRKDEILEKLGTATQGLSERVPTPVRRQWDTLSTPKKWIAGIVLPFFALYCLIFLIPAMLPDFTSPPPRPPADPAEVAAAQASLDDYAQLKAMDAASLAAEITRRQAALENVKKTQAGDDAAISAATDALERARDMHRTDAGG